MPVARTPLIYVDTSALVKLVSTEPGSAELWSYLKQERRCGRFSSMLSLAELLRAATPLGSRALSAARRVLATFLLVDVSRDLLERAGTMRLDGGVRLRTLDAIHVVTAGTAQERLRAVVTYDDRMKVAARSLGFEVVAPGSG